MTTGENWSARSRSDDWAERVQAAHELGAALPGDRAAFDRLVEMLDDANEAGIQAATNSLVLHGGPAGLEAALTALEIGPDEAGYALQDEIWNLVAEFPWVRDALRLRAVGEPGPAHDAAARIVADLKL